MVESTTNEVTNISSVLKSTFGNQRYGRYSKGTVGGSSSGATGSVDTADTDGFQSLSDQVAAQSIMDRQMITDTATGLNDSTTVDDFVQRTADVINAILKCAGGINERISALEKLANATSTEYQKSMPAQRLLKRSIPSLSFCAAELWQPRHQNPTRRAATKPNRSPARGQPARCRLAGGG